jgi:ribosomal protein S18 acetylase RimI-like enzyme
VIRDAAGAEDIATVRRLFEAYAASLDVDLCFQNFARELATLPGDYAPPRGVLLLAERDQRSVGCVALRPLHANANGDARVGEVKRLYVAPDDRGGGAGRALMTALIERARDLRYDELKLDTLATMTAAQALYASLGFRACERYYDNPLEGVGYMALALKQDRGSGIED